VKKWRAKPQRRKGFLTWLSLRLGGFARDILQKGRRCATAGETSAQLKVTEDTVLDPHPGTQPQPTWTAKLCDSTGSHPGGAREGVRISTPVIGAGNVTRPIKLK
jgi:hypothetical protein